MSAVDSRHPSQKKKEADGRWQFPNEIKATRNGRGKPQGGNVVNLRGHDTMKLDPKDWVETGWKEGAGAGARRLEG